MAWHLAFQNFSVSLQLSCVLRFKVYKHLWPCLAADLIKITTNCCINIVELFYTQAELIDQDDDTNND